MNAINRLHFLCRRLRPLGVGVTVLLVLAFLPQHSSAQCAVSYGDISADETYVQAWGGVFDYYNGACYPGTSEFVHWYSASTSLWSPAGRYASGAGSSNAYGGGGWTEAWAYLSIDEDVGTYTFSTTEEIVCNVMGPIFTGGGGGTVQVAPRISGYADTIWYFGGVSSPSGYYLTSFVLTSSAGSATSWSIPAGSDKVNLSPTSGATTTVTSNGSVFSSNVNDIEIRATANGVTSAPFYVTSRTPHQLVPLSAITSCNVGPYVYQTAIEYTLYDTLGDLFSYDIPASEQLGSDVPDWPGENWPSPTPGGGLVTGSVLTDYVSSAGTAYTPTPGCDGTTIGTLVVHRAQILRIGSYTTGSGKPVQSNTQNHYTHSGSHTSISSPWP